MLNSSTVSDVSSAIDYEPSDMHWGKHVVHEITGARLVLVSWLSSKVNACAYTIAWPWQNVADTVSIGAHPDD